MSDIHSTVTGIPRSCKSAADRMARELEKEDVFATITDDCRKQITELEQALSKKTGDHVVLVAYRV